MTFGLLWVVIIVLITDLLLGNLIEIDVYTAFDRCYASFFKHFEYAYLMNTAASDLYAPTIKSKNVYLSKNTEC